MGIHETAKNLWNARVHHTLIPRDFDGCPANERDAYAIQASQIEQAGSDVVGWKIGASAPAAFDALGVSGPFLGPIYRQYRLKDGVSFPMRDGDRLETEVAIILGKDLPKRKEPYSQEEAASSIDAFAPSFEIVGVRFEGTLEGAGPRLIADGGANVAVVLGEPLKDWQSLMTGELSVVTNMGADRVFKGNTEILLWNELTEAITWCANQSAIGARGLKAGDVIMSGTLTGAPPLSVGETVSADFGGLGTVTAHMC